MSDLFIRAFNRTMDFEGRVVENDPHDQGGQTFWGISRNSFPEWPGWDLVDSGLEVTEEVIQDFYLHQFWIPALCELYENDELSIQVFDWNVNSGARAIKTLQTLLGLEADGKVGPLTLSAIKSQDKGILVDKYLISRVAFYNDLVARRPDNKRYLKGWVKRCVRSVA